MIPFDQNKFESWCEDRAEKPFSEMPEEVKTFAYGMFIQKQAEEFAKQKEMDKSIREMEEWFIANDSTFLK